MVHESEQRIYTLAADDLDYLDELAAAWKREHDEATLQYGIGPMHHDFARLAGALHRIREQACPACRIQRHDDCAGGCGCTELRHHA